LVRPLEILAKTEERCEERCEGIKPPSNIEGGGETRVVLILRGILARGYLLRFLKAAAAG
jgi:hypothetical protein